MRRMICSGNVLATLALALAASGSALAATTTIPATGPFPYTISASGDYKLAGNVTTLVTAIIIDADNVRLNLNGKTITGPRIAIPNHPDECFDQPGILVAEGSDNVAISNGTVQNFEDGIETEDDVTRLLLDRLRLTNNCDDGVDADADGQEDHTYRYLRAWNNGDDGIDVEGEGHHFCFNWVTDNGDNGIEAVVDDSEFACNRANSNDCDGINVDGDGNIFWANTATDNGEDGIDLGGDNNGLAKNKTSDNGCDGIELERGSANNKLKWNTALNNDCHDYHDENLDALVPLCVNEWIWNVFEIDNEGDGPGAGCIQ